MESSKKRKSSNEMDCTTLLDNDDDFVETPATETAGESDCSELESMTDIELEEMIERKKRLYEAFANKMQDQGQKIIHKITSLQHEKDRREIIRCAKEKALEAAMNDTTRWCGKVSVTRLGGAGGALVETFPSGCLTLDIALGGGLPRGRVVEIYGPEGSGKTTLALHAIAEVQKLGGNAMLVDAAPFHPTYAQKLGVDIERLIVGQPSIGRMALHNSVGREYFFSLLLDQEKALEAAMNDTTRWCGKVSVTRLGGAGGALVETFPSGCLTLDIALGGGLPRGRVVEIYGPEGSGKTTLALHAIAEVQKLGGNAMLVDAAPFHPTYAQKLGVDIERLIVGQPSTGRMALDIADRICKSGAIDLICVDSVSALAPRHEQTGVQESRMSEALHKLSCDAFRAGCTLIFLTQVKHQNGAYHENPEVISGVISSNFFASVRLETCPIKKIKSVTDDEYIGVEVRVKVQKSKVSRPYKQAAFEIIYGEGVSKLGCILDGAEMMDVVLKKGSCYCYADQRLGPLGQGRDEALQHLKENPVLSTKIEKIVRSAMMEGTKQTGSFNTRSLPVQLKE